MLDKIDRALDFIHAVLNFEKKILNIKEYM